MRRIRSPSDLESFRRGILERHDPDKHVVRICCTTGCRAGGALDVVHALEKELGDLGLEDQVELKQTGCRGYCENGPVMAIEPQHVFYNKVRPRDVPDIVSTTLVSGGPVKRLLYSDPGTKQKIEREEEIPFFAKQARNVFRKTGVIDPTQIDDYIAEGGYLALSQALDAMTPMQVVEAVEASGLRGRGGAGFPTGSKWRKARESPGLTRYVLANGNEGDPGVFMDVSLMEGDPHGVIEGMIIGGYATGAHQGFIYVREEYPIAVKHLSLAVEQAGSYGLLGSDILESGFDFEIKIVRGAGAFMCGEETALMRSIEGRSGMPRSRPPYPAEKGLWGQPTIVNNVETFANVPLIIGRGSEWYAGTGAEGSRGTKILSLVGKVRNTGLIEVPMGITLREIIFDIGGGIRKNKGFKAVQTGGPSGGCIPMSQIDMPVDYDSLEEAGAIMGSGGMIVMDEDTCMVNVAKYFIDFLMDESCGKCLPCREGLKQMQEILLRICEGDGKDGDLELLEDLSSVMVDGSLCNLGSSAPNPVRSTIRYFRDEYEAHIRDKECPAGVCRNPRIIRAPEFVCEAPMRFYERCVSCPRFAEGCPDLSMSIKILEGESEVTFGHGVAAGDGIDAMAFGCVAPLAYFERSRWMCGRQGRCREEGLLLELLRGDKDLVYSNTVLKKA